MAKVTMKSFIFRFCLHRLRFIVPIILTRSAHRKACAWFLVELPPNSQLLIGKHVRTPPVGMMLPFLLHLSHRT
jgi:hypothetical protein